jgi:hypothetical protein
MKYALVIMTHDEEEAGLSEPERDFQSLAGWWADLRAQVNIVASARLAPPHTATTVTWHGQTPIVTDGPYVEAKEAVGGFVVLEVDSAVEAIAAAQALAAPARSVPPSRVIRIDVRRVLES